MSSKPASQQNHPEDDVPDYKLMLSQWLALLPILMLVSYVLKAILPDDWPKWLMMILETAIVIPMMFYVVTPTINRVLHNWMHDHPSNA